MKPLKIITKIKMEKSRVPSVLDVPVNDIDGALKCYRARRDAGVLSQDDIRTLVMGLEDASLLFQALHADEEKGLKKALPRPTEEPSQAAPLNPPDVSKKVAGAGGKTRTTYADENAKQQNRRAADPKGKPPEPNPDRPNAEPNSPHDQEAPAPMQDPIPHSPSGPKTVNPTEFANQIGVTVKALSDIAHKFQQTPELKGRLGFINFCRAKLKGVAEKHQLDSDYFGLLFDALLSPQAAAPAPKPGQPQKMPTTKMPAKGA